MKKIFVFLMILWLLISMLFAASAEEGYNDDFRYSVQPEESLLSEETDLNNPESIKKDLNLKNIFSYLWNRVCSSFKEALGVLIVGVALIFLSVIINRCNDNLNNQKIQHIFPFIVSLSMVLFVEVNLRNSASSLQEAIGDMSVFTTACIPSFSVVMIAAGEGGSATAFSGALVFLGEAGSLISKNVLLPLTDVYLSIGICSAVSDEYNFSSIARNLRRFVVWMIGIVLVVFRLIMRLQATAASAGDHVTKKYIRAAVGSLIPMVGNTLSEGVDGLFAIASGVKTTFAVAGVLIVLSIMLPSLIDIGILGFSWSVCKWIAEFMNDITVRNIADVLANSFYLMLALGCSVALMGLFSFFGIMTQVV